MRAAITTTCKACEGAGCPDCIEGKRTTWHADIEALLNEYEAKGLRADACDLIWGIYEHDPEIAAAELVGIVQHTLAGNAGIFVGLVFYDHAAKRTLRVYSPAVNDALCEAVCEQDTLYVYPLIDIDRNQRLGAPPPAALGNHTEYSEFTGQVSQALYVPTPGWACTYEGERVPVKAILVSGYSTTYVNVEFDRLSKSGSTNQIARSEDCNNWEVS